MLIMLIADNKKNLTTKKKPESTNPLLWGTIGYLFLFIFRPFEYWPLLGEYHIQRVYMICLLIALMFWRGKRYVHHPITNAILFFFAAICLSILFAYNPDAAFQRAEGYFKLLILYFVIILTVRNERDFRVLIIAYLFITGIYVGKSLWEFHFHGRHVYRMGIRRLVGIDETFSNPNAFAATIIYSLPFAWALWKSEESKSIRKGLIFYGVMGVVAIIFTGSRSGMVTLIFFMFLLLVRSQKKILGLFALVAVLFSIWQFMPQQYKLRFFTIFDESISASATDSARGRIEGLKNGLKLFTKRPMFGWGAGNFPYAVETIGVFNRMQAHNFYGQIASELGLMGIIPFTALCLLIFRANKRIKANILAKIQISHDMSNNLLLFTGTACLQVMLLLLFQGNFGHNLYRYNWLLISAFIILCHHFSTGKEIINSNTKRVSVPIL